MAGRPARVRRGKVERVGTRPSMRIESCDRPRSHRGVAIKGQARGRAQMRSGCVSERSGVARRRLKTLHSPSPLPRFSYVSASIASTLVTLLLSTAFVRWLMFCGQAVRIPAFGPKHDLTWRMELCIGLLRRAPYVFLHFATSRTRRRASESKLQLADSGLCRASQPGGTRSVRLIIRLAADAPFGQARGRELASLTLDIHDSIQFHRQLVSSEPKFPRYFSPDCPRFHQCRQPAVHVSLLDCEMNEARR